MKMDVKEELIDHDDEYRRGPWTEEEDITLFNYISMHGEGRWNSLARSAGLRRTGKSCRLRWLNYLRPDVRRGNITPEEQLLILELHSRWGNRWSKIAQHLPGRTDNEIKNYWRTRVQKHAKQLKCDVNSKQFKDTMRYLWMPRLIERIQAAAATTASTTTIPTATSAPANASFVGSSTSTTNVINSPHNVNDNDLDVQFEHSNVLLPTIIGNDVGSENSSTAASSDSLGNRFSPVSDLTDYYTIPVNSNPNGDYIRSSHHIGYFDSLTSPSGYLNQGVLSFQSMIDQNIQSMDTGDTLDNFLNPDDIWFLQDQLNYNII